MHQREELSTRLFVVSCLLLYNKNKFNKFNKFYRLSFRNKPESHKMEAVWRFRIMLGMAFAIIIFGDFLGYGSIKAEKHINRQAPTALREKQPELHLEEGKKFHMLGWSCIHYFRF